ncbi:MAG: DNA repair protein RecN [Oscillospiraceae bacterium]|jgi:DNA repair protein RecN (Recombination protein N)|nr:DNA repair protein RecN [Oscillospiraceae bacterium]
MLRSIGIENVAVIEKCKVEFAPGFNVLTGETGAGKSIVIDALGAVIGGRTGKELVRTGAESAFISAEFEYSPEITAWLSDNDFSDPEDEFMIVTRRVGADGKSSCRVNGSPVSVAQLRELGAFLIDIHGQNDGQKLLAESTHRAYLDAFSGADAALTEYRTHFRKYRDVQRKLDELLLKDRDKELRMEELRRRIDEIADAKLHEGEQDELLARRALLKNSGKLTDATDSAYESLMGGGDAVGHLADASVALSKASAYAPELEAIAERLRSASADAEDAAETLRDFRATLGFSPAEQDAIEARLALLQRLERRYGSVTDCLAALTAATAELDSLERLHDDLTELTAALEATERDCRAGAQSLTALRVAGAQSLETRVAQELAGLSMPGAKFVAELTTTDTLGEYGADDVRFLMSANAGESPGRISKIASGGELSRIMLALKVVLPGGGGTQIFDEIDAGVSGVAAGRVADKLRGIARGRQVLCVTHLPQIAAAADSQYRVEKRQSGDRTFTAIAMLDHRGRVDEIARLIGGDAVSAATLQAAGEMIITDK